MSPKEIALAKLQRVIDELEMVQNHNIPCQNQIDDLEDVVKFINGGEE